MVSLAVILDMLILEEVQLNRVKEQDIARYYLTAYQLTHWIQSRADTLTQSSGVYFSGFCFFKKI